MAGKLLPLLVAILSALAAPAARADSVRPQRAGAFRDSVGVNTHIVYFNTAYGDWPRIVSAITQLGIRHLRDGVYANPEPQWHDWNEAYYADVEYAAAHGLKFDFGMGEPGFGAGTLDQLVAVIRTRLRNAVEAVEDPNEFDQYGGVASWPGPLASYDSALYRMMKADPGLRSLPVVGPSFAGPTAPQTLGDQAKWMDIANIHPYTGGQSPTPQHTDSELLRAAVTGPGKPVWATEAGFHNAMNAPSSAQPPVSENAGAIYTLRTLLEHFKSGITRTYLYEMVDETADPAETNSEEHFGLLRSDFTPKPAYTALKNLLWLIGDGAPAGGVRPIDLTLPGAGGVRDLVLQNSAGTYAVVLWRLDSVWDTVRRRSIAVSAAPQTIALAPGGTAQIADPLRTGTPTRLPLTRGLAHFTLGADPVVLLLRPAQGHAATAHHPGRAKRR